MISNINKIIESNKNYHTAFFICVIICIISFILAGYLFVAQYISGYNCLLICIIPIALTLLILLCSVRNIEKNYLCKMDKKINDIVEKNISIDEKKKEVINYLEIEKFWGNISSYENFDNNFKVICSDKTVIYKFIIKVPC